MTGGGRVTLLQTQAIIRGADEGETLSLLGGRYTFKALNEETGLYTVVQVQGPAGLAIPVHYHDLEEEGFYVAQGRVRIFLGDEERTLDAGGFAMAPRGVRHTFRLETPGATLVLLVSPGPAHEAMFREMGEPAGARRPAPETSNPPDPAELGRIAASHGTQIVGPPPSS
jgi:quercetin dioxygenase-like cupin family protein